MNPHTIDGMAASISIAILRTSLSLGGENSETNYAAYVDFLVKNGVLKDKVPASDLITNDLIDDINKFDAAAIETMAKSYK